MKHHYHSAYGKPWAEPDAEYMRFLQWRKKESKPLDRGAIAPKMGALTTEGIDHA